jgi:hypothetical protein
MKNSTVIIRILSIIYFPLLIIVGTFFIERILSNPRPITRYNNTYEVNNAGSVMIEYIPMMSFNLEVKAEKIPTENSNMFYLKYYSDNQLVAQYKVTVLSSSGSMELTLNMDRMDRNTVGVVTYNTGDEIGFLIEPILQAYPVMVIFYVYKIPSKLQYLITFIIQIVLYVAVIVFNIVHLRKTYQYYISVSTGIFKSIDKIKCLLIGLFIPIVGAIFYIIAGTSLHDERKVLRGNYMAAGTAFALLLYILFYTTFRTI